MQLLWYPEGSSVNEFFPLGVLSLPYGYDLKGEIGMARRYFQLKLVAWGTFSASPGGRLASRPRSRRPRPSTARAPNEPRRSGHSDFRAAGG